MNGVKIHKFISCVEIIQISYVNIFFSSFVMIKIKFKRSLLKVISFNFTKKSKINKKC